MISKEDHTGQFMRGLPFFKGLPDADLDVFMQAAHIRDYHKHQHIYMQGDSADNFFVVLSGWIKLCRQTVEGEEAVAQVLGRGDIFGEGAAVFGGSTYLFSVEAAESARVIEIPGSVLKERAKTNYDILARVMNSLSRKMQGFYLENEHMALMSAPQRAGCLLLQLSSNMIGKGGTFSFPYDKSLAAARLGMKPETFSRALLQLKSAGVTSKGPEIHVENFQRLAAYCCGNCSAEKGECKGAALKNLGESPCADKKVQCGRF
ncbi:MAG: Crp/Fnr family transcriptional regulator [Micavibrio aeruginosavorus]|uniref:Crp/Fnr family transcriptional regulator n=1 Tax=Micavibrio aeruginosavorus TaxID=349221 RepID=A0A7T5UGD0_9BACT|nr:MAG: Crp/Fnr family transcriptional regulator [Micavibrio aeruginosavorus]